MTEETNKRGSRPVAISPDRLQRWRDAAKMLGTGGTKLSEELLKIRADPSRQNIINAASIARLTQALMTGELFMIANATAAELEHAAGLVAGP